MRSKLFIASYAMISRKGEEFLAVDTHLHTAYEPFDSYASANNWLDNREADAVKAERFGFRRLIREVIINTDDLEAYEPVFEVELEVTTVKRITVDIDSSDFNDVEDEDDARAKARRLCEDGEYDDDLKYASVDGFEVEDYDCEEK
jgi:hypothetical protein